MRCTALWLLVVGCGVKGEEAKPPLMYESDIYSQPEHWICHPDHNDFCETGLDAVVVDDAGNIAEEPHQVSSNPAYDCFYVYPTVNLEQTTNSDLTIGAEEQQVVLNQAARFSRHCRVFAPMYRQSTVTSLFSEQEGDYELAYEDVLDSWRHYLSNHNSGRGVVLIGHSQGTSMLARLLREEIEQTNTASSLIAAYLIGGAIQVPEGAVVGGDFESTPLCQSADQSGCVVSYLSFDETDPSSRSSVFGAADTGFEVACVHPGQLLNDSARLTPYYQTEPSGLLESYVTTDFAIWADPADEVPLDAPFAKLPSWVTAECVDRDGTRSLEVRTDLGPQDPRTPIIGGAFLPGWGLHLVDINLAMEELVELSHRQHQAWSR